MVTQELERLYRQETFLLELSSKPEPVETCPYGWLPPHLWPKPAEPEVTAEDRHATLLCLYPEDLLADLRMTDSDHFQQRQTQDLRQLALALNGASPAHFQVVFTSVDESAYPLAEALSNEAWLDVDPHEPGSLFAQAFQAGAFTPEDCAELKERMVAEVEQWQGDESLLGEIEYLSAAGQMAALAHRKLAGGSDEELLRQLAERCQDYLGYRTEFLNSLSLL